MKAQYQQAFGESYICGSPNHKRLMGVFQQECRSRGILYRVDEVFSYLNTFEDREAGEQLGFF